MKILIIDDNRDFLELFQYFLEKYISPCFVLKLEDPTTIFRNFTEEDMLSFDVIISDFNMKNIDGIQFRRFLKSSGLNIPFILVSSNDIIDIQRKYPEPCFDYFVQKRLNMKSFFQELVYYITILTNKKERLLLSEKEAILIKI